MERIITDYLEETRKRYPDKVAFDDTKRQITFSELYEESMHIACALITRELFKAPVLIYMDKCVSMIGCFAGIAYSGNFYTPIDTKMPLERIDKIMRTLNPAVIITDRAHENGARGIPGDLEVLVYEDILNEACNKSLIDNVRPGISDSDALYVLFTSGSTGTPKGVTVSHSAAIDFTDWISECYHFDDKTTFANQAQLYFDLSIQDVYAPLRNGSTTILIPNRLYVSPLRVWKLILEKDVNTLVWIPSMLSLFANLDILANTGKAPLKTVLFCGEVMPVKQLNYWIDNYPHTTFANLYGPTECTEACTYYTIDRDFDDEDVLPIGKPCDNTSALVVGDQGEIITGPGRIGELYIGGICLSNGYYNDEERTKESFVNVPNDHGETERFYKTGDLVTYNEYNELVYVSRKDHQVKIRGYRVELGEIEAAASAIEEITYNCCLFDSRTETVILVYTGDISESDVDTLLKDKLQDYMIPGRYIRRDTMLFNANGKVDRSALSKEYL